MLQAGNEDILGRNGGEIGHQPHGLALMDVNRVARPEKLHMKGMTVMGSYR